MSTSLNMSEGRSVCQSCGFVGPDWSTKYAHLQMFSCSECQSLSYLPSDDVDQSPLYTQEYFNGEEYVDYVGHRTVHDVNAKKKWAMMMPYLPLQPCLLEIGCAYGFFVNFVLGNGAKQAFGIDVCTEAIDYANKSFGPFFAVSSGNPVIPDFKFNCLVAWDVWEHLTDPIAYFSKYISLLAPGGIFVVGTIDSSSLVARFRGSRWRQIHPPTHIHYPTKKGLAKAMTSLGLEILEHGHIGHYRALESYLAVIGMDKLVRGGRVADQIRRYPILLDLKDEQVIVCRKSL